MNITPDPVLAGTRTFTATPSGFSDPDSDPLTYHYAWTINSVAVGTDSATLASVVVAKNDVVAVSVYASDGSLSSGNATDSVTVGNSAPTAGTVNITPDPVLAGTRTFTATPSGFSDPDSDPLTYHYAWTINSVAVGTDSATLASVVVAKNDVVAVSVYASDGSLSSGNATDSVTVGNSAPTAGTVNITPDPVLAGTRTFTATPSGFSDPDSDPLTYHYAWTINSVAVGTDSATLASVVVAKNDVVAVSVYASDGSLSSGNATDSVTVGNSAPTAGTVNITPDPVLAGTRTFTATPSGFSDPDSDPLTYHYAWTINSVAVGTDSATLASVVVAKNDVVAVSVYASDGSLSSGTAADSVTVGTDTYTLTLKPGWNLVAAATGTTTFPSSLFGWSGSAYVPTTAPLSWQGYWYNNDTGVDQTVEIQTTTGSHIIDLADGWNLIGNPLGSSATLTFSAGGPTSAFVYTAGAYVPTTTLLPGQGAWVQGATGQTVTLTPTT